jgi:diguanylate cyclase (GGDEF)-like protein/PAS domain S-box-containing protein
MTNAEKLRSLAEQRLEQRQAEAVVPGADAEVRKLFHELQVHQVELEIQNEELRQARSETEAGLKNYADLYDFAPVGYFTFDADGTIRLANLAGAALLGVDRGKLVGQRFEHFVDDRDRSVFSEFLSQVLTGQCQASCELALTNCGDAPRFVHIDAISDATRQTCRAAVTDITVRKKAEQILEISASVYQSIGEAVTIVDAGNRILAVNPAFTRITGYTADEVVGRNISLLKSGKQDGNFYRVMWQTLNSTDHWAGEILNRRKNGEVYPVWLTIYTIRDEHGEVMRRVSLSTDITDQKKAMETIERQANYDQLTQLPNRRLFRDRLEQSIKNARRDRSSLALLFIDLDRFKEVNDTLGHNQGDALLVDAARRIVLCLRESDTVARLGGDEFTVILDEINVPGSVERIAQNIINKLTEPFHLGAETAFVSASIGIALYPEDAATTDDLLKYADQAMYVAKTSGRSRFSYFTHAMQQASQTRMQMVNDLHNALSGNQFVVHYQPIVELATGNIRKAEALVRWQHPQRGLVCPGEFIHIAEDTGVIIEIGDWVFREAAREVKRLRQIYHPDFQISVNRSPVQFHQDETHRQETWIELLQQLELPGQSIAIEITEGLLLDAATNVTDKLRAFGDVGVMVSLDDFGTGYSAMSSLNKFRIDYLKIDQSFVRNLESDADDMALCEAIIVMAHKLGLKVIAEGVETEAQRDFLKRAGCDYAQGYLFSRPVPADELEELLRAA